MNASDHASILIVDDTEASRYAIGRILGSAGFTVHEAENGNRALQVATAAQPKVIILDVQLPDINGFEVCRRLKENTATKHIPVLHISASFVRAEDQARGLDTGADAYLTQPVERPVLLATVRSLLRAREFEDAIREKERLLEAQAVELARSNEELEAFASIVSHDLRSPLVAIGGCVQLLVEEAREKLGDEANELLGLIQNSVNQMGAMIKSLLAYARIGSGGLRKVQCDLDAVLNSVVHTLRPRIEETHGQVTWSPLPTVEADEAMLNQLFQNLVENGLKYHGSEHPRIQVSAQETGPDWTFAVRDNGIGIEPSNHQKVFHMFQRGHSDESKYEGAGVGLAACKKIVERHGGRIWLESAVGKGSTFYFTLPKQAP